MAHIFKKELASILSLCNGKIKNLSGFLPFQVIQEENRHTVDFHSFLLFLFCACMLSCVRLCVTPWTAACQAPLSMEFSRQEYWSGLPCPPPGDLPTHVSYIYLYWQQHGYRGHHGVLARRPTGAEAAASRAVTVSGLGVRSVLLWSNSRTIDFSFHRCFSFG